MLNSLSLHGNLFSILSGFGEGAKACGPKTIGPSPGSPVVWKLYREDYEHPRETDCFNRRLHKP